jgi:hypothetical protein
MLIYVCLSSHGYGHGSRTTAVLSELASLRPGWRLVLSTALPDDFLALAFGTTVYERRPCSWDVGVAQADALGVDAEATLAALTALEAQLPDQIEREAQWLVRQGQPALVLADIAPSAALLAERLDLPLVWLGNFGWDAIYGAMGPAFAHWSQRCLELYRRGQLRLECPLSLPMPWDQPALRLGLTAARPRLPLAALAEQLRLPDERWRVVVVTFGGLGLQLDPALFGLWPEHVFVGPDPVLDGLANGRSLPRGVRPLDVMPLAERLLTKPGYSSFCEAMSQQVGIHLVPRQGFAEAPMLEQALQDHGWHRLLDPEGFRLGAWQLDQPLRAPRLGPLPGNGAAQAARAIARCAEHRSAIPIGEAVGFGNAEQ